MTTPHYETHSESSWASRFKTAGKTISQHVRKHTGVGIVCAVAYFDPLVISFFLANVNAETNLSSTGEIGVSISKLDQNMGINYFSSFYSRGSSPSSCRFVADLLIDGEKN